ncbi:MAG TPA: protein kinase [Thermoanaerobaculia bacterium]|nr:protein kinase [Thermoanaerobaculia bacterium]
MALHCTRCQKEIEISFKACPHCGEPITDFSRRYADELVDGKYKIVERLGAGGMGEVFKATHTFLGTTRVIKVIRPHISDNKDAHDRFLREAKAATKVQHPNVAAMHDFAQLPDGSHYMVWEYIDGENLAQRLRSRGSMQPRAAVRIIIQALAGLEAIHRAGIIHRDISPENLMITHDGDNVKIIDLGVAKVEDTSETMATKTGIFVGKLRYASPEHLGFLPEGEKIDGRADLYSLAMVLYEMLTGRPPFEATSPHQYFILHSQEAKLRAIDYTNVPIPLRPALQRALEHDRTKRYASPREFAHALEEIEQSFADEADTATLAQQTPLPESAKVPIDTLHRSTERSGVMPTLATPSPVAVPVPLPEPPKPPTVITQAPLVLSPVIASAPKKGDHGALIAVIAVVFLILGSAAAWIFWPRKAAPQTIEASLTPKPIATTTSAAPPPQTSSTQIDVVETTTTQPPPVILTQPVVPTNTATVAPTLEPPRQEPPRVEPPPREIEPAPAPAETPDWFEGGRVYRDGGDDDQNAAAMEGLREAMSGVSRVAVHAGSSMRQDLIETLREEVSAVEVADSADVVIRFEGSIEPLGRGRKMREAHAIVKKNGRVVFRYVLPREVYRVGATPTEAFARVLSDAF